MLSTVVGQREKLLRRRVGEGGTERRLLAKVFALTLGPPASLVREKDEAPVGTKLNRCGALRLPAGLPGTACTTQGKKSFDGNKVGATFHVPLPI